MQREENSVKGYLQLEYRNITYVYIFMKEKLNEQLQNRGAEATGVSCANVTTGYKSRT
jgi:hypothetical protein